MDACAARRVQPDEIAASIPAERAAMRVTVHSDPAAANAGWAALESRGVVSPYQTRAWLLPWLSTIGHGLEPVLIAVYGSDGMIALLPFGMSRQAGLRVARFLGGRDANIALGLFEPSIAWDRASVERLLRQAANMAGIDLYVLQNQPLQWAGVTNPLAILPNQPSPSANHVGMLERDPEIFFARTLSKKARKSLRHKETRLKAMGTVELRTSSTGPEAQSIIDAYLAQKVRRFHDLGITTQTTEAAASRAFFTAATLCESAIEWHALMVDDRVAATFAGTGHGRRFCGMVVSFNADEDLARFSPGDLLIARVIERKCREGFEEFDLGVGEARYKDVFCPESEPLFDTIFGVSLRGRVAAFGAALGLRGKRRVKQTPVLWSAWMRLRRLSAGLRQRRPG